MSEGKLNVLVYGAIIVIMLAIAGAAAYFGLNKPAPVCATEALALPSPTTPSLIMDAMQQLADMGIVSTLEAGLEALEGAQYIFDPDEESELEYWVIFEGPIAAEFNFSCPLNVEGFPLDIEYEGVRGL